MLDFEPLYSTSQPQAVADFINQHYPLESLASCRLVNRGLNDVYLAVTSTGQRYVFRLSHHRARGPADVKSETAFLAHLHRLGVPAAVPIPTRSGALFVRGIAAEGMREGVLFEAIAGRAASMTSTADARANGKTLALLHNAADTFSSDEAFYRLDLDHLLRRPLARLLESGIVEDDNDRGQFEEIAVRTEREILASGDLTWTYCHGDCHGANAKINDNGEAVFFDFDDGGYGYLAYDLSVFLWAKMSFGRSLSEPWNAFIDGYRDIRQITQCDFEAAHRFVIVRHFWLLGEYASRRSEWGSESVGWIARELHFLKTWETERLIDRLL